jgi:hypothetical protein
MVELPAFELPELEVLLERWSEESKDRRVEGAARHKLAQWALTSGRSARELRSLFAQLPSGRWESLDGG